MFKHKDNRSRLNKQIRIGYLNLKKRYGEDAVQECASELWKLTSGELDRLEEDNTLQVLSTEFADKLVELFTGWKDKFTQDEWDWLKTNVFQTAELLCAISADDNDASNFLADITPVWLRIRKLTNRECYRLMDVDEKHIDILLSTDISRSAHYKLAGNSICVGVITDITENLLYPPTEPQADKHGQLSLF